MTSLRPTTSTPFALCFVALAACSRASSDGAAASSSASVVASVSPFPSGRPSALTQVRPHRRVRRGGLSGTFLSTAAELPGLAPETLGKIEVLDQQLHAVPTAVPVEWRTAHSELVAQIRTGKLDASKLDVYYVAAEKPRQSMRTRELGAIDALHGDLTPAERKAVTDGIRKQQKELDDRAPIAAKLEQWRKRLVDRLTRELTLDPAQSAKLDAALVKLVPTQAAIDAATIARDKAHEALLVAFEADTFDAKVAAAPVDPQAPRADRREVDFVAAILPIFTAEQRASFASFLTRMGTRGPEGAAFAGALDANDVFAELGSPLDRADGFAPPPRGIAPERMPPMGAAPSGAPSTRPSAPSDPRTIR